MVALASALVAALAVATGVRPRAAEATPSAPVSAVGVVDNGLFREGREGAPRGWGQMAYDGRASRFSWHLAGEGPGIASIESLQPNDASWAQRVPVSPGTWYLVSAWVRTVDVGATGAGARLSILNSFRESEQVRGTSDWRRVRLWVQTGADEVALDVACRLGGNGAVATGTMQCTGVSLEAALPPDLDAPRVFANPALDPRSRRAMLLGTTALAAGGLLLLAWGLLAPRAWRFPP